MSKAESFDYVIVGGGSAGCVLAARLSEDAHVRVLLLEAGGSDWHPYIRMPLGVGQIRQKNLFDWGYVSEPQQHLHGRQIELKRGKVLGGSSSINFMAHNRGSRLDYERWVKLGAPQWSYDRLLPYFKRTETWRDGDGAHRGRDGPVGISYTCRSDPLGMAVIEAARAAGHPIFDDLNGPEPNGFGFAQSAIDGGLRASAARAYLHPARSRRNLVVRSRSLVIRIKFERAVAQGVQYLDRGGELREVLAGREIILSGGAFNSPQLLLLSGIGDSNALHKLNITPVQHLPGVGANLQDHLSIPLEHRRIGEESPLHRSLRLDRAIPALLGAVFAGKGPFTILPSGVNAVVRSTPDSESTDIQILIGAGALEARPWLPGFNEWKDLFYLRPIVARPKSRGRLWLRSADPREHPRIDPGYLSDPDDVRVLREGFRIAREVVRQSPLDPFRGDELNPGSECKTAADIDEHIRRTATTVQHAACTCRTGQDDMAVVDAELRVRGVERLRIVDASVMPAILNCNIHAAVLAIAEWASDLIRCHPLEAPARERVPETKREMA
jgi:4-pyridoxate dehydrogenase